MSIVKMSKYTYTGLTGSHSLDINTKLVKILCIGGGGGGGSGVAGSNLDPFIGNAFCGKNGHREEVLIPSEEFDDSTSIGFIVGRGGTGGAPSKDINYGKEGSSGEMSIFGDIIARGGLGGAAGSLEQFNQCLTSGRNRTIGSGGEGSAASLKDGFSKAGADGTDGAIYVIEYLTH